MNTLVVSVVYLKQTLTVTHINLKLNPLYPYRPTASIIPRPALQWQDQGPFLEAETDDAFVQFMKECRFLLQHGSCNKWCMHRYRQETESPHDATSHKVVPTAFDSSDSDAWTAVYHL